MRLRPRAFRVSLRRSSLNVEAALRPALPDFLPDGLHTRIHLVAGKVFRHQVCRVLNPWNFINLNPAISNFLLQPQILDVNVTHLAETPATHKAFSRVAVSP